MEIRIKSDVTGKEYVGDSYDDLMERCKNEDANFLESKKKEEQGSKTLKKQLADEVERAEKELTAACEKYEEAKTESKNIMEEAKKKCFDLINPCKKEILECQNEYFNALKNFNESFGVYRKYINDVEEVPKNMFSSLLDDFWSIFGF